MNYYELSFTSYGEAFTRKTFIIYDILSEGQEIYSFRNGVC